MRTLLALLMLTPPAVHAAEGDAPARVARLTVLSGEPSIRFGDQGDWRAAQTNFPLTAGTALWTPEGAGTEIDLPGLRLVADAGTELSLDALDETTLRLTIPQGRVFLDLRLMPPGQTVTVHTPRGDEGFATAGLYEADAGSTETPTRLAVADGSAAFTGPDLNLPVLNGQEARVTGENPFAGRIAPLARDPFLTHELGEDRPRPRDLPAQVVGMTGAEQLVGGTWRTTPEYGPIWQPPVEASYVPYRAGSWVDAAPYGWTWVDQAPWGYAPTHYGRWLYFHDRWCWAPRPVAVEGGGYGPPVWAPAVVGFVSIGAGLAAFDRPPVAWVPLAPGERFRPYWGANPRYAERLNEGAAINNRVITINNGSRTTVTNVNNVTNTAFINRQAFTAVPQTIVATGAPVGPAARGLDQIRAANLTSATAPSMPAASPPRPAPPRPPFPGLVAPRVASLGRPGPAAPLGAPGQLPGQPPGQLQVPRLPQVIQPTVAPVPAPGSARPELRAPNAVPQGIVPRGLEIVPGRGASLRPGQPVPGAAGVGGPRPGEPRPGEPHLSEPRAAEPRPVAPQPVSHPLPQVTVPRNQPSPRPVPRAYRPAQEALRPAAPPFRPAPPQPFRQAPPLQAFRPQPTPPPPRPQPAAPPRPQAFQAFRPVAMAPPRPASPPPQPAPPPRGPARDPRHP